MLVFVIFVVFHVSRAKQKLEAKLNLFQTFLRWRRQKHQQLKFQTRLAFPVLDKHEEKKITGDIFRNMER